MNLKLREELSAFSEITKDLIRCLEAEEFDEIEELLVKRQNIIKNLDSVGFDNFEFKEICSELGLSALESIAALLMEVKRDDLKFKINKLGTTRKTYNNYSRGKYIDSLYFNKKV